jgi:hypothetical protein
MERDLQDNLTTTAELDKASLIEGLGRGQIAIAIATQTTITVQ